MDPDRTRLTEHADHLAATGHVDRAILEYHKLLVHHPGDAAFLNRLGDLYVQAQRLDEAAQYFKILALKFQSEREEKKAIALLKKLLRLHPEDLEAAHQLIEIFHAGKQPREAASIHFHVSNVYLQLGNTQRAKEALIRGVAEDPRDASHRIKLAQWYANEGQKEKAAGLYLEAVEILATTHRIKDAQTILDLAQTLVQSPKIYLAQAHVSTLGGRLDEGIRALSQALEHYPDNPVLLETLAGIQIQDHKGLDALASLARLRLPTVHCLPLCAQALAQLVPTRQFRKGLGTFRPLALALAQHGVGQAVLATLHEALKGQITAEVWILVADVALEGDHKDAAISALHHAYALAQQIKGGHLKRKVEKRLEELGERLESLALNGTPCPLPTPEAAARASMVELGPTTSGSP